MNGFGNYSLARPIDHLGRLVIPIEMRRLLDWNETDQIFIGVKDGTVYMKKFAKICPICRNPFDNEKGLNVCDDCMKQEILNSHA